MTTEPRHWYNKDVSHYSREREAEEVHTVMISELERRHVMLHTQ